MADTLRASCVCVRVCRSPARGADGHELVPFAGQSVGLVHEILPVAEIFGALVVEVAGGSIATRDEPCGVRRAACGLRPASRPDGQAGLRVGVTQITAQRKLAHPSRRHAR